MSNTSSSVMVLSSSDCINTIFLSELSNRYSSTFWFNAKQDDIYSLSLDLSEKVLPNEPETHQKYLQLKYCENPGVDKVILNEILQKINEKKGDCLLVMENLESIPKNFNYQLIEYLLLNCPKNLKVILISESILPLNYNKLGKFAPKILDEYILPSNSNLEFKELKLDDLNTDDIQFLSYVSNLYSITPEFAKRIYKNGVTVLDYITVSNEGYVQRKGKTRYGISSILKSLLQNNNIYNTDNYKNNIYDELFNYLMETKEYINALRVGIKLVNVEYFTNAIKAMLLDNDYLVRLFVFASSEKNDTMDEYFCIENYVCYGYSAIRDLVKHKYEDCLEKINQILSLEFLQDYEFLIAAFIKMRALEYYKGANEAIDFIRTLLPNTYSFDEIKIYEMIILYLPRLFRDSDYEINRKALYNCTKFLDTNQLPYNQLYVKALQALSEAYFDIGNCRKAQEYLQLIHNKVEFYVIPYKFLQYYYYAGDMVVAEDMAKRALANAHKYGEYRDVSYVFCLFARIYAYMGYKNEALKYSDKAVGATNCGDSCKYYSIWAKTIVYAEFSKDEYPKEIALIYAKIAEKKQSKFAADLYAGISYWCWQNGQKEEAKHYASKSLLATKNHTLIWVFSSSVLINYAISCNDTKGIAEYLENLLNVCEANALDTIFIDYSVFFVPILKFALHSKICVEYVKKLNKIPKQTIGTPMKNDKEVQIKVMSDTSICVNGVEMQWKTKKSRELFMLYIYKGSKGIERSQIFSLLWGEYIYESAINNLKTTNNIIRKTLLNYDVCFKLEYKNAKYTLTLPQYKFDFEQYLQYMSNFDKAIPIADKIAIMLDIVNIYGVGFAPDLGNPEFVKVRAETRHQLSIKLVEFIKLLREHHRYIDAKKFINVLTKIDDGNAYDEMIKGIE